MAALRAGRFYSSCGPTFEQIDFDGETVSFRCSPVLAARLVGPAWHGLQAGAGQPMREGAFRLPGEWKYARLEIEDEQGRRAWTNPLFVED
jgi:hypothetical protein